MRDLEISKEVMYVLFDVAEERGCKGKCPGSVGVALKILEEQRDYMMDAEEATRILLHCCEFISTYDVKRLITKQKRNRLLQYPLPPWYPTDRCSALIYNAHLQACLDDLDSEKEEVVSIYKRRKK